MNNRGNKAFTLIELLAVIVILSLLTLLVGVSVTKLLKETKKGLSDVQIESIKEAAVLWSADNLDQVINEKRLRLDDLKDYFDEKVLDPMTKEEYETLEVKILIDDNKTEYKVYLGDKEYE